MFFLLFLFSCIVILVIWVALSWYVNKLISCYLATKFKENKISAFITFPFSAFLILFITSFFTFGWGWFVPYTMQPSYYEFKEMCELNYMPNNEEKYNKMLAYFGKSLGDVDDFSHNKYYSSRIELYIYIFYKKYYEGREISSFEDRIKLDNLALNPPKEKYKLSFDNIESMRLSVGWNTKRRYLGHKGTSNYEFEWKKEDRISCGNLPMNLQIEMCSKFNPLDFCKGIYNEYNKQRND